ncbi:MAG TPA: uroporphyrinogen decarboxylase family protein [bacterium]|nr:uroporphyrinogen decarboxylase family protein [bacterium]
MTSRERMLTALRNQQPDMVPVAPDISNMIPCRLTGKPFWEIYLYQNPPRWKAYIEAVRYFGIDGWLDGAPFYLEPDATEKEEAVWQEVIVVRTQERIITRFYRERKGEKEWLEMARVYYRDNPPTTLPVAKIGLKTPPEKFEVVEKLARPTTLKEVKEYMGEDGVVGVSVCPPQLGPPDRGGYSIYDYHDRYSEVKAWAERETEKRLKLLDRILASPVKPDFILTGGSGMLVFNTPAVIRDIALPCLKEITRRCLKAGVPTQVHCCGPEKELVRMCAEETDLSSINPLEPPPMGDCNLKEIKNLYGGKLSLMGNLHTSEVMLFGSVEKVRQAARQAIDEAAAGGGFILSTGDQCGRDTPEANIFAMVEVARTYGRYGSVKKGIKEE